MKNDIEVAITAASQAGEYIQRAEKTLQNKSYRESMQLLTSIRNTSEEYIMKSLRKFKPNDGISSEWQDGIFKDSYARQWVIEPLSTPAGLRFGAEEDISAVMISLREEMYTTLSVLLFPRSEVLYYAELGQGTFKNQQQVQILKKQRIPLEGAHIELQQFPKATEETEFFKKADFALRSEQGAGVTTRGIARASIVKELFNENNMLCAIIHDDSQEMSGQSSWEKISTQFLLSEAGGSSLNERYKEPNVLTNEPFISAVSNDIARSILQVVKKVEWDTKTRSWSIS